MAQLENLLKNLAPAQCPEIKVLLKIKKALYDWLELAEKISPRHGIINIETLENIVNEGALLHIEIPRN